MHAKSFDPKVIDGDQRFVKNFSDGLVWHRTGHRTLYADTDRSAMVYHANYLRYFELGRATLMRDMGCPYTEIEADGYVYPIIETGIKYHFPLYYDEPMWINTRPGELGKARVKFCYIITNAETGAVVCSGFTEHCALNSSGKPVRIDEKTKRLWQIYPSAERRQA
ncbi:MAG: acyl-CoA thioesterase [Desulfosalsimonas sp.]